MIRRREMKLVNTNLLGTGYKLLGDNLSTSPMLCCDLLQQKIRACGTIQTNRIGYPKSRTNSLDSNSPQGSIRWLRYNSILFLQWKDIRDVFLCSTLHTAHREDTVQRWRGEDGQWALKNNPVPAAIKEYN